MNANTMMPKELLSAADVHDTDGKPIYLNATIAGLKQIEVGDDKERRWALCFKGTERKLTINVTNRDRLIELFGAETDKWKDQKIALHGDKAMYQGRQVKAIRVDEPAAGAQELAAAEGFDPDDIPV